MLVFFNKTDINTFQFTQVIHQYIVWHPTFGQPERKWGISYLLRELTGPLQSYSLGLGLVLGVRLGPRSGLKLRTGIGLRLELCLGLGCERDVLFNDALNTFYLLLYGVSYMVKDHSDSERGNPLPPHRLLFLISSKGSFMCTIPQTG